MENVCFQHLVSVRSFHLEFVLYVLQEVIIHAFTLVTVPACGELPCPHSICEWFLIVCTTVNSGRLYDGVSVSGICVDTGIAEGIPEDGVIAQTNII